MPDTIQLLQMPPFKRAYKKLHPNIKAAIDDAIRDIIKNPNIGEEKKQNLKGVYVHKFFVHKQQMLLAYQWNPSLRLLLLLGSHENFYRDLSKSLRH